LAFVKFVRNPSSRSAGVTLIVVQSTEGLQGIGEDVRLGKGGRKDEGVWALVSSTSSVGGRSSQLLAARAESFSRRPRSVHTLLA